MGIAAVMAWLLVSSAVAQEPEYVLVKADAQLFSQPDGDEDRAKLAKNVNLEEEPHRVFYAELLERHDGWVKVRTASYRGACTRPLATNAPTGMVLWVRPVAIVKTITRVVELSDGDATVKVYPGTPVDENVDASFTVAAMGLTVTGAFPADSVGQKYRPITPEQTDFRPTHGSKGTFGTEKLKIETNDAPAMSLGGDRWSLERRCLEASGPRLTGEAPVAGEGTPDSRGGSARRIKNAWALTPGAQLVWPDMVDAGVSTHHYRLANDDKEDPDGLICGNAIGGLELCAANPETGGKLPGPIRYAVVDLKAKDQPSAKHPKGDVKGEDAKCRVQIDVSAKGEVQSVDVRACEEAFREAAEAAVKEWTFIPHKEQGQAVPARTWTFVKFEG